MIRRAIPLFAALVLFSACDDETTTPSTDGGAAPSADGGGSASAEGGSSGGSSGATSDCAVAYSCRADSGGITLNCVEASAKPNGAKEACEGQAVGGLTYVFSEGPCPREGAAAGCLLRENGGCQVSWIYGPASSANAAGVETFVSQCRAQGHEPVAR